MNRPCAVLVAVLVGVALRPVASGRQSAAEPVRAAGGVRGEVRLSALSPMPRPTRVENTTDPAVCGRTHTLDDWSISGRNRGVQHVIVTIEGVPADRIRPVPAGRLVLDNRMCGFLPHASVLTAGSTIEAVNSDPVLHTVHFYGPIDVNIALPLTSMRVSRRLDTPGLFIVKCDVHGWMQAFVKVDPHPFHAVTGASGAFQIPDVPPGDYVLHAWHEKLGDHRETISVRPGAVTRVMVTHSGSTGVMPGQTGGT